MVCRVFQKCVALKKPLQQTPSSLEPSIESPCEANSMVNEFGDIELPNLNTNIANSSSAGFNNMNWVAAREAAVNAAANGLPTLPWTSSLLNASHLSMNSLLLKALQLRNGYQVPRDQLASANHDYSFLAPQGINVSHQFGTDLMSPSTNSFQASSSNKMIVDTMPQQQQEQQAPFNLDSIW